MTIPDAPDIEFAGGSDIGSVREENQDSIRLPSPGHSAERGLLYALADGMGGLMHGKLASSMALDSLYDSFYGARAAAPNAV